MAVIKNIEQKIKLATVISVGSMLSSVLIVIVMAVYFYGLMIDSRKNIYVLDRDVPIFAKQTDMTVNRPVEYTSHIDLFHSTFFTIAPDNKYIEYQMNKALYLIDESGMQQYTALQENGFFSQILSSSSVMTIQTDSIKVDEVSKYFKYYGKQTIERRSATIQRDLITEGYLKDVPRSTNNPHGVMIQRWKTLKNEDVSVTNRRKL